jgi:nucleotide-binding universal stress UspA family protein
MFKRILVATDGSKLSAKAIRMAARLAGSSGATLTGAFVMEPYSPASYGEAAIYVPAMSPKRYKEVTEREARKALALVEIEARTAGADCDTTMLTAYTPWEGILRAAKAKKCDLIVMASHGRRGLTGLVLGSETTKVLTHSKIPVLVCR